ncbi:bacillithiol biosynthesis cysteine-adding enzyme BshC [Flammeovirga aprica]|uniref:Putative cysteine ligase BshC n=1 Tax=Flammeovirga aprica JL-4 TaxID=694437 RepID=A0A7X9RR57_9BACT|nr:bacillithiol biosynthesis cysteine-adding enzyme BshC [Flammeovirga aprica]NME67488.1 bacillithiol biosynthesis cysteine-adding enzyme BshC [Flammeovirga aprica JL-4]
MNTYKIPFETAGLYGKMFLDYLSEKEEIKPLYQHSPQLSSFDQIIENRSDFTDASRQRLVQSLHEQYSKIEDYPSEQIDLLLDKNTYTIITGHQLNIFTGPLFFVYKIAATINLCKQLKEKYPDKNFIPVYWMATEDHDFEEIASFQLGGRKYTWEHPNASGPVGRLSLEGMDQILDRIKDMPALFVNAYRQSENLTEASRKIVNELFKEFGLVCVDADHKILKEPFREIIKKELFEGVSYQKVTETNAVIEAQGYKTQIYAREINLFYMEDGVRLRLEKTAEGFQTVGGDYKWTSEEMNLLVDESPEKFSPNVVLRPVLQEVLLPNLAYLGGPAEVVYWLQLKSAFDAYNVKYPMVLPRGFCLVLDGHFSEKWRKSGWPLEELLKPKREIEEQLLDTNESVDTDITSELVKIELAYNDILTKASAITPNLKKHVDAEMTRMQKRVQHTQNKLRKEGKRKIQDDIERVLCIRECLLPNNAPQERIVNLIEFWPKNVDFIPELIGELDPLSFNLNVMVGD